MTWRTLTLAFLAVAALFWALLIIQPERTTADRLAISPFGEQPQNGASL